MQKYADPIKTVLKNVENVIIDIEDIEDRLEIGRASCRERV